MGHLFQKSFIVGFGLACGLFTSVVIAVTIQGSINTFSSGDLISASQINENFESLRSTLENLTLGQDSISVPLAPVGTIVAWHKDDPGTPTLPDGWAECNGQAIADPDALITSTPNLNNPPGGRHGGGVFLRGSLSSSGGIQSDTVQNHQHYRRPNNESEHDMRGGRHDGGWLMPGGPHHPNNPANTGNMANGNAGTETRPVNFPVVWIIRYK